MKIPYLVLSAMLVLCGQLQSAAPSAVLDSNTAFYDGEKLRYVFPAPRLFRMVQGEAAADGYSFAFIPKYERYDSASVIIGVNIYKMRGTSFDSVVVNDTALLRGHFGAGVTIRAVQPMVAATNESLVTFYLDSPKAFLPNVALAYFDGGSEIVIFELVLTQDVVRHKAEEVFADCVRHFQPLKRGTLGTR